MCIDIHEIVKLFISFLDKIFLYNPTSLNSSTPHPHTLSISDLRASLPRVLLQVSQLHRGKYPGLGITAQSLDLALTTSLHLPFPHSTAFTSINTSQVQLWPPTNSKFPFFCLLMYWSLIWSSWTIKLQKFLISVPLSGLIWQPNPGVLSLNISH